jgi:hypothetical protein
MAIAAAKEQRQEKDIDLMLRLQQQLLISMLLHQPSKETIKQNATTILYYVIDIRLEEELQM